SNANCTSMLGGKPEPMAVVTWPALTTPGFIFNTGANEPAIRSVACAVCPPVPTTPIVAVAPPPRVTVAATSMVHVAPGPTEPAHVVATTENSSASGPLSPDPASGTAVWPGFLTVNRLGGNDVPTTALPKLCEAGVIVNEPGIGMFTFPFPTSETDTDSPSPDTVIDELALPPTVGVKTTVIAHDAPGANRPPQPLVSIANGAAGDDTAPMLIATFDVLVTTAFCGGDCTPRSIVPKSR